MDRTLNYFPKKQYTTKETLCEEICVAKFNKKSSFGNVDFLICFQQRWIRGERICPVTTLDALRFLMCFVGLDGLIRFGADRIR